jgi:hypothetical protein
MSASSSRSSIEKLTNWKMRMADQQEQEVLAVAAVETPADFLANLGKALRDKEDVDGGLVDILAKHLLTATPHVGAVAGAKDAILKLASERANPPKPELTGG